MSAEEDRVPQAVESTVADVPGALLGKPLEKHNFVALKYYIVVLSFIPTLALSPILRKTKEVTHSCLLLEYYCKECRYHEACS